MTTKEAIYKDVIKKGYKDDIGVKKAIDELFNVFKINRFLKLVYIPMKYKIYAIDNKSQFERIATQHLYQSGDTIVGIGVDRLYHTLKVRGDRYVF